MAICETTRPRRKPKRAGPLMTLRPLDFNTAPGETCVARKAGVNPNRMQVSVVIPAVKPAIRQSMPMSINRGALCVLMEATSTRVSA